MICISDPLLLVPRGGVAGAFAFAQPRNSDHLWSPETIFDDKKTQGWYSGLTMFPIYLWYDFRGEVSPAKITCFPRRDVKYEDQMPTRMEFIASNEEVCKQSSRWVVLCTMICTDHETCVNDGISCNVSSEKLGRLSYRCLGVRILETKRGNIATLKRIKMSGWK